LKRRLSFVFLLALVPSLALAQTPEVVWEEDYEIALEQSLLSRKPILVTFQTSWCGWCRKLEASTFRSAQFKELTRNVVPVRVDGDRNRGLVGMFRVTGFPTTILVNRQGKEIARVQGYKAADAFVQEVLAGLARREPFREAEAAAAENPGDPGSVYALGDVLLALRRFEPAREALSRVAGLDPQNATDLVDDARLDLALTHFFAGEYETAADSLTSFLEAYPGSDRRDQGVFFQGLTLIGLGREKEGAARILEAASITDLEYIKREAAKLEGPGEPQG